ncbi:MAG: DUF4124 domain-containing protein [Myxococcota bacterium]|nr:DUF4124 domain-containing protein [Myxococcota bacterium]
MTRAGWAIGLALLLCSPAAAEMYRCQGKDGKTLYTSDKSQCPGADAHTPRGQIQSVPASAGAATSRPRTRAPAASVHDEAQARSWQRKKQEAIAEQKAVADRRPYVEKALRFCNRGNKLYVEDEDGMRKNYSCEKVEAEAAELARRERELEAYLDQGGLEDECRRAGCLPGWIRD